jgi:hypothetical protein
MSEKEMCPCGFPQSWPIPHEHDQTEREKVIIRHYESRLAESLQKCKMTEPPPPEMYRVIWVIDVEGENCREAAKVAWGN